MSSVLLGGPDERDASQRILALAAAIQHPALEAVDADIQDQSHGLATTPAIAPDGEF